mgnify:CR=1 FL=1
MPYKPERRNSANTMSEGLQDKVYGSDRTKDRRERRQWKQHQKERLGNNNEMWLNGVCRRIAVEPEGEGSGKRIK